LGATDVINATEENPVGRIGLLTEAKGVDYSFEAVGNVELMSQAVDVIGPGGKAVFVGTPRYDAKLILDAFALGFGKTITAIPTGGTRPTLDIPRFLNLHSIGKLPIDKLLTRTYKLHQINDAIEALEKGEVVRSAIVYD
jgi:S-(hydroxymethyl)glutathione dehydrogenase/alcohol dehydrogenase